MARIFTYPTNNQPSLADSLLGSNTDNNNKTSNYRIADLTGLLGGAGSGLTDGIYKGTVVWLEGLDYLVSDLQVVIGGVFYIVPGAVITLTSADPLNSRIDIITVKAVPSSSAGGRIPETSTQEAILNVIDGIATANPVQPTIPDRYREIQLTFVEVQAGATEPLSVFRVSVYDENAGQPVEWDATENSLDQVINLQSPSNPNTGLASIAIVSSTIRRFADEEVPVPDEITFAVDTPVFLPDISSLHMYVRLGGVDDTLPTRDLAPIPQNNSIVVRLFNDLNQQVGSETRIEHGQHGFNESLGEEYQSIVIPTDAFSSNVNRLATDVSEPLYFSRIVLNFEGTLSEVINIDTIDLTGGVVNPPISNTWVSLEDTDSDYSGKAGYRSTVRLDETGLELVPSGLQNGLISGSVVWTSGLTYEVSDLEVVIDGAYYEIPGRSVTLDDANENGSRIDLITVNARPDVRTSIRVLKGVVSSSPIKPIIPDSSVELELTFAQIDALATEPLGVSMGTIYDENAGSPTEWDVAENTSGLRIDLENTEFPNTGLSAIKMSNSSNGDRITFTSNSFHALTDISSLHFYVRLSGPIVTRFAEIYRFNSVRIRLYDNTTPLGAFVDLMDGAYGFNIGVLNVYQSIVIPISAFTRSEERSIDLAPLAPFNRVIFNTRGLFAEEFFIDTFNLIGGVNNTPTITNTWIALDDTDNDFIGKAGYRSTVSLDETRLELAPSGLQNGLISGSVVWVSGLTYEVSDLEVVIGGAYYNIDGDTVTLNDADPTYSRIDIITVNVGSRVRNPIQVIDGVPSSNPIKPSISNSEEELELISVQVDVLETEPAAVSSSTIYDENAGTPTEWNVTESTSGARIDLENEENPREGTNAIKASSTLDGDLITFASNSLHALTDISSLHFYVRLSTPMTEKLISLDTPDRIRIRLLNSGSAISNIINLQDGTYGLNTRLFDVYQSIVIPISAFTSTRRIDVSSYAFDGITFTFDGTLAQDVFIDTFNFIGGVNPTIKTNSWLALDDTDTDFRGKAGYSTTVSLDETRLELTPSGLENGLISGSVVWLSGLTYEVSDLEVVIGGTYYMIDGDTVTLDAADADDSRIDIITVNVRPTVRNRIQVRKGVGSATPAKPIIPDSSLELELTFAQIGAEATEPIGVSSSLVYDEHAGSPTEWSVAKSIFGQSIQLDNTEHPNTGTRAIRLHNAVNNARIVFSTGTPRLLKDISSLHFYIRLSTPTAKRVDGASINIYLYSSHPTRIGAVRLTDGAYGLNTRLFDVYQSIVIPVNDFIRSTRIPLEVYSFDEIVFEQSGLLSQEVFIDTFNLVEGVNAPTMNNTWLSLDDTDSDFKGKAGYRSTVRLDETGLELTPSGLQDRVITGSVVWLSGLSYEVSDLEVIVGGAYYKIEGMIVHLSSAHATLSRIDIITVNVNDLVIPIKIIEGVASTAPVKPTIPDSSVELEITFAQIDALATEPVGISNLSVYSENDGSPSEWDVTENTSGARIDLENEEHPGSGTNAIKVSTSLDGDLITFTSDSTHVLRDISTLHFYVRLSVPTAQKRSQGTIIIRLLNGGTVISGNLNLRHGTYGLNGQLFNGYQSIIIPINDINLTPKFSLDTASVFDGISFEFDGVLANEVFIDNFNLIAGVNVPTMNNTYTSLTDTDNDFIGKAGYVLVVDEDERRVVSIPQANAASRLNRLNDEGNVNTAQVIDWSAYETWDYVMTDDVTFTEINTPSAGNTKTITVYISGGHTPTIPVSWDVKEGAYDPLQDNQYVVEWVKSGKVWVQINSC